MTEPAARLLDLVVRLGVAKDRARVSEVVGRALGGERLIVFVRDSEVGVLLPAPGYPTTLRNARAWMRFLDTCVSRSQCFEEALAPPEGGDATTAYGFASGDDVVAVVLGATGPSPEVDQVRALLPLLAATVQGERAAANAQVQARLARQAAAEADALARSLDATRGHLQRALAEAQATRMELEQLNHQLQDQAMELEAQTETLQLQTEELQQANVAFERARDAADGANRAKSEFLAMMSHELRTPLNAIAGHVQLIELGVYGAVTDEQREALRRVDRSQRHLLALINDVLNLSRIEAGRVEYALEDLSLRAIVEDLRPMIEPQLQAKGLRFDTRILDEITVRADCEKLQQILLNLLANAVKFTEKGGTITVSGLRNPDRRDRGVIQVTDTGMGIPSEKLQSVFEPFVQVDSSHSREQQGAGLGLAISRDLARGMGGELNAESTLGKGSTFTLTLPLAATTPVAG